MIARRLDEVLAQTDPFDLAQAVDRRAAVLSVAQIRALIHDALPRMNEYYTQEFARIQTLSDEASVRSAFAQSLKSNLRAIPLFGPSFGESLIALTPSVGAVGFADERPYRSRRWATAAVVSAALIAAGIAGGHFVSNARSLASTSTATSAPVAAGVVPAPFPSPHARFAAKHRRAHHVVARTVSPETAPPAPPPVAYQSPVTRAAPVAAVAPQPQPRRSAAPTGRMPVAHGSAVVVVPQHKPKNVDAVQANGIDMTDMPETYTDATPLPQETARPVTAPRSVRLATPTPAPKRHGWLYRSIYHLDPFKPHPQPEGTP